jgi:hypothetical protein
MPVKRKGPSIFLPSIALLLMLSVSTMGAIGGGGGVEGLGGLLTSSGYLLPLGNSNPGSNITTVGIQYKPVIPSQLFQTGPAVFQDTNWNITLTPELGHSFGMVIRKGFTDRFSLEVGINQTVRKYKIAASFNDTAHYTGKKDFRFLGYEIPIQGLVYVRLGERVYMNNAFGLSLDMFPTDIATSDEFFLNETVPLHWLKVALIANVGFEFRSEENGFFYIGGSLHRPFSKIATTRMTYLPADGGVYRQTTSLIGNFLTIDLRYFFHEDAEKKQRKQSRRVGT